MSLPAGQHVYSVPQRFGLTSIFALTTLMAILFGSLRRVDFPPNVYFCLGVMTLAICCVQMYYGSVPRLVSVLTGACMLPGCAYLSQFIWEPRGIFYHGGYLLRREFGDGLYNSGWLLVGAVAGYLGGVCLAGIFLVQDLVEAYFASRHKPGDATSGHGPEA